MGGCSNEKDWKFTPLNEVRTLVLVGRAGNGKSATANSILRKNAFMSKTRSSNCELQRAVLEDGLALNVIDTPGLFDSSAETEFVDKEIVRCIDMAKDGIHTFLVVLSVRSRFSREEEAVIIGLQKIFGPRISDYMVVVFTGGDDLEENDETLDDYLGRDCHDSLKEILRKCGNRRVLFDNRSKDEGKRAEQLKELLFLVDEIIRNNGGKPFSDEIFAEFKKGEEKLLDQSLKVNSMRSNSKQEIIVLEEHLRKAQDEQMNQMVKMVEEKMKKTASRLEQQRTKEKEARIRAEKKLVETQKKSMDEVYYLRENLKRVEKRSEDLRKAASVKDGVCAIL